MLGGVLWMASWYANGLTEEGTQQALGLTERQLRLLLIPALVLMLAGLWAILRRYRQTTGGVASAGAALGAAGLVTMILGNALEFGLSDGALLDEGEGIFVAGALIALLGHLALGFAVVRVRLPPSWSPLPLALGAVCFLGSLVLVPFLGLGWVLWGFVLTAVTAAAGPVGMEHETQAP